MFHRLVSSFRNFIDENIRIYICEAMADVCIVFVVSGSSFGEITDYLYGRTKQVFLSVLETIMQNVLT